MSLGSDPLVAVGYCSSPSAGGVAGQQAVEAAAGLLEDGLGLPELVLRARLGDLHGGDRQRLGGVAELMELTRGALADGLPRRAHPLTVGLDVGGALVGQRERLAPVVLGGTDEALVLQLRQRGVDRAGARAPDAAAALLELLHQAVAVAGLLGEQQEDRGADVTAPRTPAATAAAMVRAAGPTARTAEPRTPAEAEPGTAARPAASAAHHGEELGEERAAFAAMLLVVAAPVWRCIRGTSHVVLPSVDLSNEHHDISRVFVCQGVVRCVGLSSAVLACVAHPWRSARVVVVGARRGSGAPRGGSRVWLAALSAFRVRLRGTGGRFGPERPVLVELTGITHVNSTTTLTSGPKRRSRSPGVPMRDTERPGPRPRPEAPAPRRQRTTNPRPATPATAHSPRCHRTTLRTPQDGAR